MGCCRNPKKYRALRRDRDGNARRIIVSLLIAEASLTIKGVMTPAYVVNRDTTLTLDCRDWSQSRAPKTRLFNEQDAQAEQRREYALEFFRRVNFRGFRGTVVRRSKAQTWSLLDEADPPPEDALGAAVLYL